MKFILCYRVDHSLVMGQASTLRLTLHGNHTNRRVACYSFSAPVMKVHNLILHVSMDVCFLWSWYIASKHQSSIQVWVWWIIQTPKNIKGQIFDITSWSSLGVFFFLLPTGGDSLTFLASCPLTNWSWDLNQNLQHRKSPHYCNCSGYPLNAHCLRQ